jgi:hypothetical protein
MFTTKTERKSEYIQTMKYVLTTFSYHSQLEKIATSIARLKSTNRFSPRHHGQVRNMKINAKGSDIFRNKMAITMYDNMRDNSDVYLNRIIVIYLIFFHNLLTYP